MGRRGRYKISELHGLSGGHVCPLSETSKSKSGEDRQGSEVSQFRARAQLQLVWVVLIWRSRSQAWNSEIALAGTIVYRNAIWMISIWLL